MVDSNLLDVLPGFSVGIAIVLAIILVAVVAGIATARRRPTLFRLARSFAPATGARPAQPFVGRQRELEEFRKLFVDPDAGARRGKPRGFFRSKPEASGLVNDAPAAILLISGEPGIGKRALLERFQRVCEEERRPARCGAVIDLRNPRPGDEVLEEIAQQLVGQSPAAFSRLRMRLTATGACRAAARRAARKASTSPGT